MSEPIVTSVVTAVSTLGLWFLVTSLYRDYRVDAFRQEMFALRDQLFDEVEDGKLALGFEHPAYGMLRSTMNGFIRFGHRLSFFQVVVFGVIGRSEKHVTKSFTEQWEWVTGDLEAVTRERVNWYLLQVNSMMLRHVIISSPVLMVLVVPPLFVFFFLVRLVNALRAPIDRLDSTAMAEGEQAAAA